MYCPVVESKVDRRAARLYFKQVVGDSVSFCDLNISRNSPFWETCGPMQSVHPGLFLHECYARQTLVRDKCHCQTCCSVVALHNGIQSHLTPHNIFKPWGGEIGNPIQCNWTFLVAILSNGMPTSTLTSWGVSASSRAGLCQRTFICTFPWRCRGARLDWNQHADHHPLSLIDYTAKCQSTRKSR